MPQVTQAQLSDNPYPIFHHLLTHDPVAWVPAFDMWMITRRADVVEILRDAETFTMEPQSERANPMEDILGPMMLSIDGPDHKRIRDVFIEPFRPKHVREWYTDVIERIAHQLVDELLNEDGFPTTTLGNNSAEDGFPTTTLGNDNEEGGFPKTTLGNDSAEDGFSTTTLGNNSAEDGFPTTTLGNDNEEGGHVQQPPINEPTVPPLTRGMLAASHPVPKGGGQGGDLDKHFSDKLAIYTVVAAIGFEVDDLSQFRDWYEELGVAIGNTAGDDAIRQRGKDAFEQFRELVLAQIELLRARPNNSVLSEIVHNASNVLTQDEIVSNIGLTFFGGVETTSAMLSNTLWALLVHPEQFEQVRREPTLLPNALEEAMRWETPVQSAMRFPTRDVTVAGIPIRQGEKIYCMLGAANRDPAVFDEPDRFDIHRENANQHLGFAYGPHFCFGAPLARMEATIGLSILFERLPNLRFDPEKPSKPVGHEFRSPTTLHCCWD